MDVSSLALPPHLVEFVRVKMNTGEYASENEVVCEALTFLRERDELRSKRLRDLQSEVRMGRDQLARGDSRPFDAQEIKDEVRKRLAADSTNR